MRFSGVLFLFLMMTFRLPADDLNAIGDRYVQLVLAVGVRDSDYVDAYFGHTQLREEAEKRNESYEQIAKEADAALTELQKIHIPEDRFLMLRHEFLKKQLQALRAFVQMRQGKKFSFDEESQALYDAVSPRFSENHFAEILQQLDAEIPGKGDLPRRFEAYQNQFVIPKNKLDSVFQIALKECRERTKKHIQLPESESFTVEYVTDQPWSGYNWYKGDFHSVIQVNTDLPIYVDRAIDLAGHEGYPGHHVYNVLLEQKLFKKRKWNEFSVYPLFSPESLIAEGSANYGVDVLFSGAERIRYEQQVIFPAAGIDPSLAPRYYKIRDLMAKMSYAGNEAARNYLDGIWSKEQTLQWLQKYSLYSRDRAKKRIDFIKKYRSYVINYNLGQDMVKAHIESLSKNDDDRWKELAGMLGSPILPSGIAITAH